MRKNTMDQWKHIPAGSTVDTGMGLLTAPKERGYYTLYEIGTDDNYHVSFVWEKEDDKKSTRRTGGKGVGDDAPVSPVPDANGKATDR